MGNNLYIRADSDNGVLTNEDDIKYYKATQDVEIISNYLLGNFNNDGEYIIDNEIVEELVEMPKGITNEFSNMIFCVSKVVTEYVEVEKFVVKTRYDEDDPSIKISTLEVLEDVKKVDGYYVNSLSTPIAEFVDIATENYKEKMFEAFNILDKDQFAVAQTDKFVHGKVSLRRKYVASIQKICEPQLDEVFKQAYQKKLEILKQSGEVGKDALKLFEDRLKNKPTIATKNNYKALNELLDSVIEVHKEQLKPVMPQIREVGVDVAEKVEQIQKLSFQNLKNMQKTPQGLKAIQIQQDSVFNNKTVTKPTIKKIITQEVKETDYAKNNEAKNNLTKDEEVKPVKKERVNILKNIFGIGNNDKKTENSNTKDKLNPQNNKTSQNTQVSQNKATNQNRTANGYSEIVGKNRKNQQQKENPLTNNKPEKKEENIILEEKKPQNKFDTEKPQTNSIEDKKPQKDVFESKKPEKDNFETKKTDKNDIFEGKKQQSKPENYSNKLEEKENKSKNLFEQLSENKFEKPNKNKEQEKVETENAIKDSHSKASESELKFMEAIMNIQDAGREIEQKNDFKKSIENIQLEAVLSELEDLSKGINQTPKEANQTQIPKETNQTQTSKEDEHDLGL